MHASMGASTVVTKYGTFRETSLGVRFTNGLGGIMDLLALHMVFNFDEVIS